MEDQDAVTQLVVIGSSAGGIEALSTLVATLPEDFPAPIVIAQHLDPRRVSHLGAILERHSRVPIRTVTDHDRLLSGTIYVVPANQNVEITNHHVTLTQTDTGPRPSIDLLLGTAANIFSDNLIAVILTGTGSDGAAGAFEVKQAGGTVVIQNPRTAAYPMLPASLPPTVVDLVANIEDIGPLLASLLANPALPAGIEDGEAVEALLGQLQTEYDVDFRSYKQPTIMRRLRRRMSVTGNATVRDYVHYLRAHPEEYRHLISNFLIKVTKFFRDAELFEYLRDTILPGIIQDARRSTRQIRVWSAGCATGEEAYSIAILLAELLGPELDSFDVRIFATDLDIEALDFARRGVFSQAAVADVPPDLLEKYFTPLDGEYQIKKNIRALTIFGAHDLAERAPFPRIDLLMCRNVLIYFGTDLQRHVLQLFGFSLRDGGYLVLGKSETVSPLANFFATDNSHVKVYRRRGDRTMLPLSRIRDSMRVTPLRPNLSSGTGGGSPGAQPPRTRSHVSVQHEQWSQAMMQLPVGVVIIDHNYDIHVINSAARRLLGIYGQAVGQDLVHLAQELPGRELRMTIESCLRTRTLSSLQEVEVPEPPDGTHRYLDVLCQPYQEDSQAASADYVAVVVIDVTEGVQQRLAVEAARREKELEAAESEQRFAQVTAVNRELRMANDELNATNMELRSINEEFLVGNEELQAAAEEVETLNEELQATNEELETLNEELQATVEELNATNDDLQARSGELQELAVSLEEERRISDMERARLSAILVHMADAVLAVDTEGKAVLTNAAFGRMFGNNTGDFLALDEAGGPLPPEEQPQARAARGDSFSLDFTIIRPDGSHAWFEANGQPIGANGDHEGGVLVIRDISDRVPRRTPDETSS